MSEDTKRAAPVNATLRYIRADGSTVDVTLTWDDPHEAMIAANAALPDGHPGKITREMVDIIREAGKRIGREGNPYLGFDKNLQQFADTLATLLPPR